MNKKYYVKERNYLPLQQLRLIELTLTNIKAHVPIWFDDYNEIIPILDRLKRDSKRANSLFRKKIREKHKTVEKFL